MSTKTKLPSSAKMAAGGFGLVGGCGGMSSARMALSEVSAGNIEGAIEMGFATLLAGVFIIAFICVVNASRNGRLFSMGVAAFAVLMALVELAASVIGPPELASAADVIGIRAFLQIGFFGFVIFSFRQNDIRLYFNEPAAGEPIHGRKKTPWFIWLLSAAFGLLGLFTTFVAYISSGEVADDDYLTAICVAILFFGMAHAIPSVGAIMRWGWTRYFSLALVALWGMLFALLAFVFVEEGEIAFAIGVLFPYVVVAALYVWAISRQRVRDYFSGKTDSIESVFE